MVIGLIGRLYDDPHEIARTHEPLLAAIEAGHPERITLITDCMSPVEGFADQHVSFLDDMRSRGVRLATAMEVLSVLRTNAA